MSKTGVEKEKKNELRHQIIYQVTTQGIEGRIYTDLHVTPPSGRRELILFTNGTGRADFDEAHRFLAEKFSRNGLGYCHIRVNEHVSDSLSSRHSERVDGGLTRYSFETIGKIILSAAEFVQHQNTLGDITFCLFGSGDGAASALYAAAIDPASFTTMILSGARLSSALTYVAKNSVPTLFVLGTKDNIAAKTTRTAYSAAPGRKKLLEIDGAGHLLREPGALEDIAEKSLAWIDQFAGDSDFSKL